MTTTKRTIGGPIAKRGGNGHRRLPWRLETTLLLKDRVPREREKFFFATTDIVDGVISPKTEKNRSDDEDITINYNSKALNVIYDAVDLENFKMISTCYVIMFGRFCKTFTKGPI